jgi:hypothetical protein
LELLKRSLDNEYEKMNNDELWARKKIILKKSYMLKFKEMEAYASLAKCYSKTKRY